MLVLSRQRDETIMIGDDVQVTVVDIRGEKVRLGITAPPHIPVHRKEVYEAIKRENQAAAEASGESPHGVESLAQKKHKDTDQPKEPPKDQESKDDEDVDKEDNP
jgi:carbon storage regulator